MEKNCTLAMKVWRYLIYCERTQGYSVLVDFLLISLPHQSDSTTEQHKTKIDETLGNSGLFLKFW